MDPSDAVLAYSQEKNHAKENTARMDIDSLVTTYYGTIRRLAFSILDEAQEAEDAAQETFIAACRSLEEFRGEASPKTWLTGIAINICRGRLRKHKSRRILQSVLQVLHLVSDPTPGVEQAVLRNEQDRQIWQAVDALDEKHRLVVVLRYVHDLSTDEIAAVLKISPGTVHSRLHYARKTLMTRLRIEEETDETEPA
jgi:RNA polymerase sigma-70 factor (ECF subfamily)